MQCSPCRHHADSRTEERGDGDNWQGWAGILPQGEEEICPRGSVGRRPPTMVGRPREEAWRKGPQNPYATTPRWVPLVKFGSPGMMVDDDGWVLPRRDATSGKNWTTSGTCISPGRGTHSKYRVARADGNQSGSGSPTQGQPHQPVTA